MCGLLFSRSSRLLVDVIDSRTMIDLDCGDQNVEQGLSLTNLSLRFWSLVGTKTSQTRPQVFEN